MTHSDITRMTLPARRMCIKCLHPSENGQIHQRSPGSPTILSRTFRNIGHQTTGRRPPRLPSRTLHSTRHRTPVRRPLQDYTFKTIHRPSAVDHAQAHTNSNSHTNQGIWPYNPDTCVTYTTHQTHTLGYLALQPRYLY